MVSIHEVLVELFIESVSETPEKLIPDFDATDDRVHGNQEGRACHGYYRSHCFLPLYVFCNDRLLVSCLRPGNVDGAQHAGAIPCLLARRLRQQWPEVRIIFRGDSGFCRRRILGWCERHGVRYITGIGRNPRYVVTNLEGDPQELYDRMYCARGEMENRIREQQMDMFADRTSCSLWWSNQYRMLLSGLAYVLLEQIRRRGLYGTRLARAYVGTLRLKLLRIGAVIVRNTRRVVFMLSGSCPYQDLFRLILNCLTKHGSRSPPSCVLQVNSWRTTEKEVTLLAAWYDFRDLAHKSRQ